MNTAAFIHGVRDIRVSPFTPDAGSADTTLVEVASVGICGSDLHYYKDGSIGSAAITTFAPTSYFWVHRPTTAH